MDRIRVMSKYLRKCQPFPEHMSSSPVSVWFVLLRSLVFCVVFCTSLFVLFLLCIVLSVLRRCTIYDYPFGIFKLFFLNLIYSYLTWKFLLLCYYTRVFNKIVLNRLNWNLKRLHDKKGGYGGASSPGNLFSLTLKMVHSDAF